MRKIEFDGKVEFVEKASGGYYHTEIDNIDGSHNPQIYLYDRGPAFQEGDRVKVTIITQRAGGSGP
ncbi:MAG: hypothetical protein PHU95_07275 [Candidatus Thermoplasmatota archaeon]|nr:hypothetical protein [Candidatus Thermoplasmatota archaeon]MDD5779234.1 hypothetical protein [Candidatus Thermoplasmatota archaeon]